MTIKQLLQTDCEDQWPGTFRLKMQNLFMPELSLWTTAEGKWLASFAWQRKHRRLLSNFDFQGARDGNWIAFVQLEDHPAAQWSDMPWRGYYPTVRVSWCSVYYVCFFSFNRWSNTPLNIKDRHILSIDTDPRLWKHVYCKRESRLGIT